jgi:hypothetical protein
MDSCGFKVTHGVEELSFDCVELVLSVFHHSNKNMTEKAKLFSLSSYIYKVLCPKVAY